jgi:hypothetical protein
MEYSRVDYIPSQKRKFLLLFIGLISFRQCVRNCVNLGQQRLCRRRIIKLAGPDWERTSKRRSSFSGSEASLVARLQTYDHWHRDVN